MSASVLALCFSDLALLVSIPHDVWAKPILLKGCSWLFQGDLANWLLTLPVLKFRALVSHCITIAYASEMHLELSSNGSE